MSFYIYIYIYIYIYEKNLARKAERIFGFVVHLVWLSSPKKCRNLLVRSL